MRLALILIATLSFLVLAISCDSASTDETLTEPESKSPKAEVDFLEPKLGSLDGVELLRFIQSDFTNRALERDLSRERLGSAFKNGEKAVYKALGISHEERRVYESAFTRAVKELESTIEDSREMTESDRLKLRECTAKSEEEKLKAFLDIYQKKRRERISFAGPLQLSVPTAKTDSTVSECQWVIYTVCLIGCTGAGPIYYWPCAAVCYCSFCAECI